ncbi:restriction endonuclease subunit S [Rheinheimera baltica]|uniref:Restriction endonuclease subunit S n=1 Tax=Rheinheimera baltica TaxID=67576 RepID=A0ABT9HV44_9GAMM|nr:restriction endonuclease subunit S [Rheinheimera baltica]MDP5134997.1 restriction endonuclease subunit S [Rheinheimera baltica]
MSELLNSELNLGPHPQYPKSVKPGIPRLAQPKPGWKTYRIGELFEVINRPVSMEDEATYQLVTVKRARGGVCEREKLKGKQISVKSQFYVKSGDFLISKRQIVHGACGFVPEELDGAIVSNEYAVLHCKDKLLPRFLNYLMHTPYFQQTCFHSSIGVHVEKMIFKLEEWFRWRINIPSVQEQIFIADFLDNVDKKYAYLNFKLNLLEKYKFSISRKIFSQNLVFKSINSNNYPAWKTRKLKDFAKVHKGGGLSKNDTAVRGAYKCLLYGELFTKYKESITETSLYTNKEDGCLSKAGDILMPASDVTPYGLATASTIFLDNVRVGGDINIIRLSAGYNPVFFTYQIKSKRKEIIRLVTGTTVKHLYPKDILNISFFCPVEEEQEKIANFLSTFDRKIEAVEQQILKLERFKQGLLQQMFV